MCVYEEIMFVDARERRVCERMSEMRKKWHAGNRALKKSRNPMEFVECTTDLFVTQKKTGFKAPWIVVVEEPAQPINFDTLTDDSLHPQFLTPSHCHIFQKRRQG